MNFQSVFLRLFLVFVKLRFVLLVSCLYYVIDSSEKRNNLKDYKILGKKARFGRSGFTATIDWILMGQTYPSVPHLGTDFKGPLVDSPHPFDFIKEGSEGQKHIPHFHESCRMDNGHRVAKNWSLESQTDFCHKNMRQSRVWGLGGSRTESEFSTHPLFCGKSPRGSLMKTISDQVDSRLR